LLYILFRTTLPDVNDYIGLDLSVSEFEFSEDNDFNNINGRNSELSNMCFIYKFKSSQSFYWSIWIKN